MNINFVKMHGLGNDFAVINNTQNILNCTEEVIKKLAHRNLGIGFDQLIILEKADYENSIFFYRIYNADGGEVYQCGNGARCLAKYLLDSSLTVGSELTLKTVKSSYKVRVDLDRIYVNMGLPIFDPVLIPYKSSKKSPLLNEKISEYTFGVCSLGNPHAVICVDDVEIFAVNKVSNLFSKNSLFPEGVNIGFMQVISSTQIKLRVFERGAGETLACGSGACAAVVIGRLNGLLDSFVNVHLPGGELEVSWDQPNTGVMMIGGASTVFEGTLYKEYINYI